MTVEAFGDFLEVCEREYYVTLIYTIGALTDLAIIVFYFKLDAYFTPTLLGLGLVLLANELLFLILSIAIPKCLGWLRKYDFSLSRQTLFANKGAMEQLVKTAIPLSFGNLLAYGEWNLLTIFAVILGPAEAAT